MKIAITMRVTDNSGYHEIRDVISHDWIRFFESHSLRFCFIPSILTDYSSFLKHERPDAVILSNGNNVAPHVGRDFVPGSPDAIRNYSERLILDCAISLGIPVLGVCYGMHFINNYFKGGITSNINNNSDESTNHVASRHDVKLMDSKLIKIMGANQFVVNSFHNQGIRQEQISDELIISGITDDIVEFFIHKTLPIAGIQWHPERDGCDKEIDRILIKYLFNGYKGLV